MILGLLATTWVRVVGVPLLWLAHGVASFDDALMEFGGDDE